MLSSAITSPGTAAGMTLRAWVLFSSAGTLLKSSTNVSSVTRTGAGAYTINLASAMADSNTYMDIRPIYSTGAAPTGNGVQSAQFASATVPAVNLFVGGTATDLGCYVGIYG